MHHPAPLEARQQRFDSAFAAAQRRYDAQEHPDYYAEDEPDTWPAYVAVAKPGGWRVVKVVECDERDSDAVPCRALLRMRDKRPGELLTLRLANGKRIGVQEAERIVAEEKARREARLARRAGAAA